MQITDDQLFSPLLLHEAPLASRTLLEQAQRYFGFVPNLLASLAHSPSALKTYLNADLGFQHGTLTPVSSRLCSSQQARRTIADTARHRIAHSPGSSRMFRVTQSLRLKVDHPFATRDWTRWSTSRGNWFHNVDTLRGRQSMPFSQRDISRINSWK